MDVAAIQRLSHVHVTQPTHSDGRKQADSVNACSSSELVLMDCA